ncbi:NHLP leader peptide domain [Pannonibacter phragmitetus]|uniref:NHLP leader peptide domain n=1 Tax=Pannonibacter phragmitetus TaxID=121719 RepID=A0A378ZUG1_9HYPH|nr:NHLP leader peptide family RiPP precursor [Pannonibacter phragmitetus]SUB00854.1 NHLP leader peptide domain [Pannonibacter phragmitetus]
MTHTIPARLACEALLREKAAGDAEFRARLVSNPAEAVAESFGQAPKDNLTFRVIEEAPGEVVLVLPPLPGELSDAQLAAASGGYTVNFNNSGGGSSGFFIFQKGPQTGNNTPIAWAVQPAFPGSGSSFVWDINYGTSWW